VNWNRHMLAAVVLSIGFWGLIILIMLALT